jgi:hypothetical protein
LFVLNQAPAFRKLNDFVEDVEDGEDIMLSIPLLLCDEVRRTLIELDSQKATACKSQNHSLIANL